MPTYFTVVGQPKLGLSSLMRNGKAELKEGKLTEERSEVLIVDIRGVTGSSRARSIIARGG